jgi:hypothetical protein
LLLYFVSYERRKIGSGKLESMIEGVNVLYYPNRPQVLGNSIERVFSFILALFPYQRKESKVASLYRWDFSRKGFLEKILVLLCGWCVIVF